MRLRCSSLHRWGEWGGGWGGGQFSRLWMKPVQQSTSLDGISSSLLQKSPYNIQTVGGPACPLQAGSAGLPVGAGFTKVTGHKPPWVPGFLWPEKALKGAGRFHGTVRLWTLGLSRVYIYIYFFLQFSPDWMLQVRIEDDVWPTTSEWQLTLSVRADLRTLSAQITAPLARLSSPNPHKEKRTEGKGALTGTSMGRKKVLGFARITRKKSSGEHVRGMRYEPISPGYCTVRNYARVFLVFFFNVVFSFGNTSLTQSTRVTFVLVG